MNKYPQEVREFLKVSPLRNKALQTEILNRFGVKIELKILCSLQAWYQGRRKKVTPSFLTKPLGTERKDKDGYIRVRVGDGERLKHHLVWEKDHEPLKRNEVIMFKDGDKTNCNISNLIKVERKYLSVINRLLGKNRTPELLEVAIAAAKLQVESVNKRIYTKRNQPNCQPRKENYGKIIELYNEGYMPFEIAKKLNAHINSVRWSLRKYRAMHNLENPY